MRRWLLAALLTLIPVAPALAQPPSVLQPCGTAPFVTAVFPEIAAATLTPDMSTPTGGTREGDKITFQVPVDRLGWGATLEVNAPGFIAQSWRVIPRSGYNDDSFILSFFYEVNVQPLSAKGQLHVDDGPLLDGERVGDRLRFRVPANRLGWGADLNVSADGYKSAYERVVTHQGDPDVSIELEPNPALPRLVLHGRVFAQEDGGRLVMAEADCFPCYQMFLDGGAARLAPVLEQLACLDPPACDHRFNMLRTIGMFNNPASGGGLGQFMVAGYGERYFEELPAYHALLAKYGFYDEFVVFADATTAMPAKGDQIAHWNRVIPKLALSTNVIVEVGNELDQPINRLDSVQELPRPPSGLLASHGSNGSQSIPVEPFWDYLTFHTNGAPEEQRKTGHNCWEITGGQKPCSTNEISRVTNPTAGIWALPDARGVSYDMGRAAVVFTAGLTFHSQSGKYGDTLDGEEVPLAKAMIAGMRSYGDRLGFCQDANPYKHGDAEIAEEQRTGALRVYQFGNDAACRVSIRTGYPPVASIPPTDTVAGLPKATHPLDYLYYVTDSYEGNFRDEVASYTNADLVWTYMGADPKDVWARASFEDAIRRGKKIVFGPDVNPRDTELTPAALDSLRAAAPYWDHVAMVYFDELGLDKPRMEEYIDNWNAAVISWGLQPKPVAINFHRQQMEGTGFMATNIDLVGVEAYIDPAYQNDPHVVDLLTMDLAWQLERIGNRFKFIVMQAYDRNGEWKNMTSLAAIQKVPYLAACCDPLVTGVWMFSWGRGPGGSRYLGDTLASEHRKIWEALR